MADALSTIVESDPSPETEERSFGRYHEELEKARLDIEKQRLWSRKYVLVFAALVVGFMAVLEVVILWCIIPSEESTDGAVVWLAVTPIVSITFVVIFATIGVFRGFREGDMNAVPVQTAGRAVIGQGN